MAAPDTSVKYYPIVIFYILLLTPSLSTPCNIALNNPIPIIITLNIAVSSFPSLILSLLLFLHHAI